MGVWSESERIQSSIWKELEAVERMALLCRNSLEGQMYDGTLTIKCGIIVNSDSRNYVLQSNFLEIWRICEEREMRLTRFGYRKFKTNGHIIWTARLFRLNYSLLIWIDNIDIWNIYFYSRTIMYQCLVHNCTGPMPMFFVLKVMNVNIHFSWGFSGQNLRKFKAPAGGSWKLLWEWLYYVAWNGKMMYVSTMTIQRLQHCEFLKVNE